MLPLEGRHEVPQEYAKRNKKFSNAKIKKKSKSKQIMHPVDQFSRKKV